MTSAIEVYSTFIEYTCGTYHSWMATAFSLREAEVGTAKGNRSFVLRFGSLQNAFGNSLRVFCRNVGQNLIWWDLGRFVCVERFSEVIT